MKWTDELVFMIDRVRDELGVSELTWQTSDLTRERVIAIARERLKHVG